VAWVFVRAIVQHTKDGFTFSYAHSHTKHKQKEQLRRLQTPQIVLRKPKGKKENQREKIKIEKILKTT
jgi:hypothetical protein